jgi:hypothetical protein
MWDLWWDKVALGQVFFEYFSFPCNRRSLHQLLHNHPHVSSGECTLGQCGRRAGTYRDLGDLKPRNLRSLNLGDLKKGPKGAQVPPHKKKDILRVGTSFRRHSSACSASVVYSADSCPVRERPLGKRRRRWKDNIEISRRVVCWVTSSSFVFPPAV